MPDLPTPVRTAQMLMTGLVDCDQRRVGAHEPEVGAGGEHRGRLVHHVGVADVAVREDDFVDVVLGDELGEAGLGHDGDARRVARAGERGGEGAVVDPRDLRRGEGDELDCGSSFSATRKLWKSRPAAPMMTTRRGLSMFGTVCSSRTRSEFGRITGSASMHKTSLRLYNSLREGRDRVEVRADG